MAKTMTAMQMLIETMYRLSERNSITTIEDMIVICSTIGLEAEKKQIVESYNAGLFHIHGSEKYDGVEYYEETFIQN